MFDAIKRALSRQTVDLPVAPRPGEVAAREPVLLLREARDRNEDALLHAMIRGGYEPRIETISRVALQRLARQPCPVVVEARAPGAEYLLRGIRAEPRLRGCPTVAIVPEVRRSSLYCALAWGADEVVPSGATGLLMNVLRAVEARRLMPETTKARGEVVVGAPAARAGFISHALQTAGFTVRMAHDMSRFVGALADSDPSLGLVDLAALGVGPGMVEHIREQMDERTPLLVLAPRGERNELEKVLRGHRRARVVHHTLLPEVLAIEANELIRPPGRDKRASRRILHNTVAAFQLDQHQHTVFALTYDVSAEGLWIRTVLPPPDGSSVRIQIKPAAAPTPVVLDARVARVARYSDRRPGSPPGFGARIVGGTGRASVWWRESYRYLTGGRWTVAGTPHVA